MQFGAVEMPPFEKGERQFEGADFIPVELELIAAVRSRAANPDL